MGYIHILSRSDDQDTIRFKKALKMAKQGIMEACELAEEMEEQFSDMEERGGRSSMRGGYSSRYSRRDDWDEMDERLGRDSMGRYR